MNPVKKKYFILMVGVMYLGMTLFLEMGHTDIIEGGFGGFHKLFNHDCNGKELHHPLGKDDQCPVCVRNSQTTAFVHSNHHTPTSAFEIVGKCTAREDHPGRERTISSVRGPPLLTA